ncbi:MAG: rod-binding protein [Treponema sp.]|nr:rod-binding protein [Treponema sp.]
MEINNFGLINIDDYRLSSQSSANSPEKFADALKRASAANAPAHTRPGQEPIDKEDKLYQLCLELETFLVKNLLTSMRNTVQKSGLVDEGFAGKMYEDMLYDEYAKDYTKNANFGLAEQAYRQLKSI